MKHALSYHDYQNLCAFAEQTDDKYQGQYLQTLDCMFTHWTAKLGHDKICVLGFILSRTLKYGKAVAAIPFPAFLGGVTSERCSAAITSALKISKNTLRNILKELIEDGFLHAFFPEKRRGIIDNFTRYFEIDINKLQRLRSVGSKIMGMLRTPKAKKVVEETVKPRLAVPRSRLPKLGDLSTVPHVLAKANSDSPAARRAAPEDSPTKDFAIKRILRSRPTPALDVATTVDEAPATKSDIIARIDAMQAAAKARREAKTKTITGNVAALKQDQVQAVVDRAMVKYYPDLPRLIVTGKAFGAMKNHLKRSTPSDLADFINWAIRSWSDLSLGHAKTAIRKMAQGDTKDFAPIPKAPHFASFGFRMPYFLACYNNRKAEDAKMGTRETRDTEAIAKANRATEHARQEAASLRILLRKANEERRNTGERRSEPRVDDKQRRSTYDDLTSEQEDLPTWESLTANDAINKRK